METEILSKYLKIIQNSLSEWENLTIDTVSFTLLTGTSNKVFKVTNQNQAHPLSIIFRVFGPDEVTNKSRERKIFEKLGKLGLGPKTLAVDSETRIEEYLEDFLPLTYPDLFETSVISLICDRLRVIHQVDMEETLEGENEVLYENLQKWRNIGNTKLEYIEDIEKRGKIEELLSDSVWQRFLSVSPRSSEKHFVHLDLNFFNILFNRQLQQVALIDFEFSGFGHQAFDFAFLFSDMRFDYLVNYSPGFAFDRLKTPDDRLIADYVKAYGEGKEFWVQVKKAFVVCNYVWAVWDLAMWVPSRSGYDYLENALLRFHEYLKEIDEYFQIGEENFFSRAEELFVSS